MFTKDRLKHFSDYFVLDFETLTDFKPLKQKRDGTLLYFCDKHEPFGLQVEFPLADTLVIGGDFFDMYSRSHFKRRTNPPISFKWEFRNAYERLVKICKNYPVVYLMMSNHDLRLDKFLFDNASPEIIGFCETGVIQKLIGLIPNIQIVQQSNGRGFNYVWQYRDIIFTHIEKSAMQDSKILEDIEKHLYNWKYIYRIKGEYNCIIQAHNHRVAYQRIANKHCYLAPCLINIDEPAFDYVFNGKCYGKPPALGYMQIQMKNDKFDFANSKMILL